MSSAPGVRATRQRAAISALLENLDYFRSAHDLHDELRRRGEGIGLTTVYRTLQSMATAGLVDTLRTDTGESVYRRCSDHNHHHLVCRVCGCTVEVQGGTLCTDGRLRSRDGSATGTTAFRVFIKDGVVRRSP